MKIACPNCKCQPTSCDLCNGLNFIEKSEIPCLYCGGTGITTLVTPYIFYLIIYCSVCKGSVKWE